MKTLKNQTIYTYVTRANRTYLNLNRTAMEIKRTVKNIENVSANSLLEIVIDDRMIQKGVASIGGKTVVVWAAIDSDYWDIAEEATKKLLFSY